MIARVVEGALREEEKGFRQERRNHVMGQASLWS